MNKQRVLTGIAAALILVPGCATLNYQKLPETERKRYFELAAVSSQETADRYTAISDSGQRQAYWESFWKEKDPTPNTDLNERYEEHLRRVDYADQYFPDRPFFWDDRGRLYVKYGEPDYRETAPLGDDLYGGSPFTKTDDIGAGSGIDAPVMKRQSGTLGWERWTYNGLARTFSFVQSDVGYRLVKDLDNAKSGSYRNTVSAMQAREVPSFAAAESLKGDLYTHDYGGQLDFNFNITRFWDQGRSEVWVYYGVPVSELYRDDSTGSSLINRSVVIFDRKWREAARQDEVISIDGIDPKSSDRGVQAVDVCRFLLAPGDYNASITIMDMNSGKTGIYKYPFQVLEYVAGSWEVSDILLAGEISMSDKTGKFVRNSFKILPRASGVFSRQEDLYFYYESYNLLPDKDGRYQAVIKYYFLTGDPEHSLTVAPIFLELKTSCVQRADGVSLKEFKAGDYTLVVEISDVMGGKKRYLARKFTIKT